MANKNPVEDPLARNQQDRPVLLLMRHPQTVYNLNHRYLGQVDAPLSELGEEQRVRAVEGLVSWRPDRIVTSPLLRCRAIADEACERLGLTPIVDDDVAELNFGVLEGKDFAEATALGLPFPWGDTVDRWPCEGGEPLADFSARTHRAADRYAAMPGRTAVVSHGGAIRSVCTYLMHLEVTDLWHMSIDNVSSAIFAFSGPVAFLQAFGLRPEELAVR